MPKDYDLETVPDVDFYVAGLRAIQPTMKLGHFRLLRAQCHAPGRVASATELALLADIGGGHTQVNRLYGGLGHMFCDATGFSPRPRYKDNDARWWAVWSTGHTTKNEGFLWEMRWQVAEALRRLGWVDDELIPEEAFHEKQEELVRRALRCHGRNRLSRLASAPIFPARVSVVRLEFQRNPHVAAEVILAAGGHCDLCGAEAPFKREADGMPYLEVHHILPLSRGGEDTIGNTVALCPNCHRKVHYGQNKDIYDSRLRQTAGRRACAPPAASDGMRR